MRLSLDTTLRSFWASGGGKGLACLIPFAIYFNFILMPIWVLIFLVTVLATRMLVLGQIIAILGIPIVAFFVFPDDPHLTLLILAALIFIRHAPRLKSVLDGTEPKLYYKLR